MELPERWLCSWSRTEKPTFREFRSSVLVEHVGNIRPFVFVCAPVRQCGCRDWRLVNSETLSSAYFAANSQVLETEDSRATVRGVSTLRPFLRCGAIIAATSIQTLISAFTKRVATWTAIRNVSMFGMDAEQFRTEGRKVFGDKMHGELVAAMREDAQKRFRDQLMIVGWGSGSTPQTPS